MKTIPLCYRRSNGLSIAVVVLSFTALRRLNLILSFEIEARNKLDLLDKDLGISEYTQILRGRPDKDPRSIRLGYRATIALPALAAVFTIIFGS